MSIRDRRYLIVVAVLVAGVTVVAALGPRRVADAYSSWATSLQTTAEDAPQALLDEQSAPPGSEAMLLVVTDDDGRGAAFALLTTAPDGPAVLVTIPAPLYDLLPGYGIFPLGDAMAFEGTDLTVLTTSNALGVRIDGVLVLSAAELSSLVGDGVVIDLASPLLVEGDDGTVVRVAAEGERTRSGEVVASLFIEEGDGDQLALLERQAAAWEGVVRHVGNDAALVDQIADAAGPDAALAAGLFAAAGADDLEVTVPPLAQVGAGSDEGFEAQEAEVSVFVVRRLPHLALSDGPRSRVEILNGNGQLQTTRTASEVLVRAGYRIVRTDNAENFDFAATIIVAQGRANADEARRAVTALGTGDLRLELQAPSGIIDVSIIVGADIATGEG